MNIILTGEKRVGKSFAMTRFLENYKGSVAGFRTVFSSREDPENRKLVLYGLPDGRGYTAIDWKNAERTIRWEVFDEVAPRYLGQSAGLIVVDEFGRFETECERLRSAAEAAFSGDIPVLAVVRADAPGWMGELMKREDVTVLTVTEENRDGIPAVLEKLLG